MYYTKKHNAICADYQYCGYPKHICVSVNDVVCHGIPSDDQILQEGDIVNVDATTMVDGYFADASRMFMIGKVSKEAKQLVEDTKKALAEKDINLTFSDEAKNYILDKSTNLKLGASH